MPKEKLTQKWIMDQLKLNVPCEVKQNAHGNVYYRVYQASALKDFILRIYRRGEKAGAEKQRSRIAKKIKAMDDNIKFENI